MQIFDLIYYLPSWVTIAVTESGWEISGATTCAHRGNYMQRPAYTYTWGNECLQDITHCFCSQSWSVSSKLSFNSAILL